jgi:hypothetical protein
MDTAQAPTIREMEPTVVEVEAEQGVGLDVYGWVMMFLDGMRDDIDVCLFRLAEGDVHLDDPENVKRGREALREVWVAVGQARSRMNRDDL